MRQAAIFILVLLLSSSAWAQTIPAYISDLNDYEVRSLSGTYTPTNGNEDMRDVTSAAWLDEPGSGLCGSCTLALGFISWSGGFKGIGTDLWVTQGGHADSANNGVYRFDFTGTTAPTGWTLPTQSLTTAPLWDTALYADGLPTSIHTYDGTVYANHNSKLYRFSGAGYGNGLFTNGAHEYDPATGNWTNLANMPKGMSAFTLYDETTHKIFVGGDTSAASEEGYFYRIDTDAWSGNKISGPWSSYSTAAYDTTRDIGIILSGGTNYVMTMDFSAETVSRSTLSATGDTAILSESAPSIIYDPTADVYWIFGGPSDSPGWTNIYEMNADGPPWVITAHALSGDSFASIASIYGTYGRLVLMDDYRAIGLVVNTTGPAYVIKLPDGLTDCEDGIDNDGDGMIDGLDPSCTLPFSSDLSEDSPGSAFETKCKDAGTQRCYAFEDQTDMTTGNQQLNTPPDQTSRIYDYGTTACSLQGNTACWDLDTATASTGKSALRFEMPGTSLMNTSADFRLNFAPDLSTRYAEGDSFYVQYRYRMSPEMLGMGGDGLKSVIIGNGDWSGGTTQYSCTLLESVITTDTDFDGPIWYHSCGNFQGLQMYDPVCGNQRDQSAYDAGVGTEPNRYCCYSHPDGYPNGCWQWPTDTWMTVTVYMSIGTWNTADSDLRVWITPEGGSTVLLYDTDVNAGTYPGNFGRNIINNLTECAGIPGGYCEYGKVWLLNYDPNKTGPSSSGYVWYDDLIITTTSPLDAPSASTSSAVGVSITGGAIK